MTLASTSIPFIIQDNTNMSLNASTTPPFYLACPTERFYLNGVVAGSICGLGLFGNCMSLAVLMQDRQSPMAAWLLAALALVDNAFLILWFLQNSLQNIFTYAGVTPHLHPAWTYVRLYVHSSLFVAQTATIWLTVLIAGCRYVAVCWPHQASFLCSKGTAKKGVVGVLLFSVIYNLPRFFEYYIIEQISINGTTQLQYHRTALSRSHIYRIAYNDVMYYIFSFVLPLIILAILNTMLTLAYRTVQIKRQRLNLRTDSDHNITLVMIIVVLVFMLCQAPARIVQIVWNYTYESCWEIRFFMMEVSNVLEVLNSSVNFIIYCVFRQHFRHIIQSHMCSKQRSSNTRCLDPLGIPLANGATSVCIMANDVETQV